MANPEHLAILKQGVEVWNKWRKEHPGELPNLEGAQLENKNLSAANLEGAVLAGAKLRMAFLIRTSLREANCHGADLAGARLLWADMSDADFSAADLRESNLTEAQFRRTNLAGTRFGQARTLRTSFDNVDISVAEGLGKVVHYGPSSVGVDTIYRSKGDIPEVFLRGCGVPDNLIGYIRSLAGSIQFYSCFISYSTKDQQFADRVYADLQARGVRCWFAPHDIAGGKKIHEQIDEAIRLHDKLLLILSEHSMSSDWVQTEIAKARKRETQDKRQMLFPVALVPYDAIKEWECFDADRGKDSAREVREYFIPDFSNWKDHDSYQKAFRELERGLKAEGK